MGSWVNYWRIVKPEKKANIPTILKTDSDYLGLGAEVSAISWYNQVMRGIGSRIQKYKQFDLMDTDIDVSRALDTIAEEIGTEDNKNHLPLVINYQIEDSQEVNENIITTIRAAVRHWSNLQDLNSRIFNIARTTIKYGDCFFKRSSVFKKWEFIDPTSVVGIEVNQNGENVAYHISKLSSSTSMGGQKSQHLDVIPAEYIIHFSLTDLMSASAPFGDSILLPVLKTYKQLTMLEDAMVIYRIVRAPERRVFYIDVGNMPAQRVNQYLEQVKNDVRQKRMPNSNGPDTVDGTYNPQCFDMNTKVPLLDGRTLSIYKLAEEYKLGKVNWAYSCNPETGEILPGEIKWAGITRKNADVVKITFDNGKSEICTPDHKFPVQGLGFVRADELTPEHSLIPFNRRWINENNIKNEPFHLGYEEIFDISKKQWVKTHKMVSNNLSLDHFNYKNIDENKTIIHHKDFNKHNNKPDNLVLMGSKDHFNYHADHNSERFDSWDSDKKISQIKLLNDGFSKYRNNNSIDLINSDIKRKNAIAITNDKNGKNKTKRRKSNYAPAIAQKLKISNKIISLLIDFIKSNPSIRRLSLLEWMKTDSTFINEFLNVNKPSQSGRRSKPSWTYLEVIKEALNARTFSELKYNLINSNHKIVKIEFLKDKIDTGCITIGEKLHKYHTFAIEGGVFTKNSIQEDYYFPVTSAGRGSRVETLPGGENLGENGDVRYFQDKIFRGLRVPTSYMRGSDAQGTAGAQVTDGKVGVAYIEELRFANYIKRLQNKIERVLDDEFKLYLNSADIKVDDEMFILKLPDPQNFALYRQAALDSDLINTFNTAEQIKYLSRRFILKRFLGFNEDDLQMNEIMLKQERGILDDKNVDDLQQIYNPIYYESPDKIDELNQAQADTVKAQASETPPEESEGEEISHEKDGEELSGLETSEEETSPEEASGEKKPEEAPGF